MEANGEPDMVRDSEPIQVKVKFSRGYDNQSGKFKKQTGVIEQYLLGEVVEVRTSRGKLVRLYKSEYKII